MGNAKRAWALLGAAIALMLWIVMTQQMMVAEQGEQTHWIIVAGME